MAMDWAIHHVTSDTEEKHELVSTKTARDVLNIPVISTDPQIRLVAENPLVIGTLTSKVINIHVRFYLSFLSLQKIKFMFFEVS